jgi:hypothetical protein
MIWTQMAGDPNANPACNDLDWKPWLSVIKYRR